MAKRLFIAGWRALLVECVAPYKTRSDARSCPYGLPVSTFVPRFVLVRQPLTLPDFSYTPLAQLAHMPAAVEYDPIRCKGCGAVLNPFWCVLFVLFFSAGY